MATLCSQPQGSRATWLEWRTPSPSLAGNRSFGLFPCPQTQVRLQALRPRPLCPRQPQIPCGRATCAHHTGSLPSPHRHSHSGTTAVASENGVGDSTSYPEAAGPALPIAEVSPHALQPFWAPFLQALPRAILMAALLCLPTLLRPALSLAHGPAVPALSGPFQDNQLAHAAKAAWTGLVAGCLHTLTGPDHLAALAPLTIGRSRVESAAIGALWGCGHDAGQVLFGILFVLLRERLHLDIFHVWGPRIVGLTLIAIGLLGAYEARVADHEAAEDHQTQLAPAVATPILSASASPAPASLSSAAAPAESRKASFSLATFATGIVHGLQPDALLVVLPAMAMPSRVAGAAFLALFLLGTVLAMGSYTAFIGSCSDALRDRVPGVTRKLSWAAAFLAMALGCGMLLGELFGLQLL